MPVFEGIRNRFCVCFCSGLVTLCPDAVLDQIQFIIQKVKRRRETYLNSNIISTTTFLMSGSVNPTFLGDTCADKKRSHKPAFTAGVIIVHLLVGVTVRLRHSGDWSVAELKNIFSDQ